MQFTVVSALALATTLGAATVTTVRMTSLPPASECKAGDLQCCDSAQNASSANPSVIAILTLLDISPDSVTGLVGVNCRPISVIGVEGNSCSTLPVCCTNNTFNGAVALGCTLVDPNL